MKKISVRKRTGRTGEVTYQYYFTVASVDGKQKREYGGGYATEQEAYNAGVAAKAIYDTGDRPFSPEEVSLADYMDFWLGKEVIPNSKQATISTYTKAINIHIKPAFGKYLISSIDAMAVQEWITACQKRLCKRNG